MAGAVGGRRRFAQRRARVPARLAAAAARHEGRDHVVADVQVVDAFAEFQHLGRRLVTECHRHRPHAVAIDDRQVRMAEPRRADPDQHFAWPGRGQLQFLDEQRQRLGVRRRPAHFAQHCGACLHNRLTARRIALGHRHRATRLAIDVHVHETSNRRGCTILVREQHDPVDHARVAELLEADAGVHDVREGQLAQEAAAGLGDDADRRHFADVAAGGFDQPAVHRGVEVGVVDDVVDVTVVVVVQPARRDRAQDLEVLALRQLVRRPCPRRSQRAVIGRWPGRAAMRAHQARTAG